jgi:hypothetical protein
MKSLFDFDVGACSTSDLRAEHGLTEETVQRVFDVLTQVVETAKAKGSIAQGK